MNRYPLTLGAALVCCAFGGAALGGIHTPPPWAGQGLVGGSTHWEWQFHPGPGSNIGTGSGAPGTQPPVVTGGQPFPTISDGAWILPPGQSITIDLWNYPNQNDFKLIWIQYHLLSVNGAPALPPVIDVQFGPVLATPFGPPNVTPLPDGGLIGSQGFRFPFNPPIEIITITNVTPFPMIFDWLVIDTICAPTPGAGAALVLGAAAVLRRRR